MSGGPIVAVGESSFLSRMLLECRPAGVHAMGWREALEPGALADAACVVGFALDPTYRAVLIEDDTHDLDARLAAALRDGDTHYVMLSSRAVYRHDSQWMAKEDSPLGGLGIYGRNKLRTERRLVELLGPDRVTIVRCANVIGPEWQPGQPPRGSFMGQLLKRLYEDGCAVFDISPFVRKDFVTTPLYAACLESLLRQRPPGPVNLGSGIPIMAGELAIWAIEGYGSGRLLVESPRLHDEFLLDVGRLASLTGLSETREDIADYCRKLGRMLRKRHE